MGLTERHWFENEDVPENYEWDLEDAVYNSCTNKKPEDSVLTGKGGMTMTEREKAVKGLEWILEDDRFGFGINWETGEPRDDHEKAGKIITNTIALLKEQDGLAKAVDQEHRVNEYLNKQLADRPEIVRCKDCKRYYANGGACDQVLADWFCADGTT